MKVVLDPVMEDLGGLSPAVGGWTSVAIGVFTFHCIIL